jgi:hypothetical protein
MDATLAEVQRRVDLMCVLPPALTASQQADVSR